MKERRDAPDPMKAFRAIALIITQRGEAQVKLKAVRSIQQEKKAGQKEKPSGSGQGILKASCWASSGYPEAASRTTFMIAENARKVNENAGRTEVRKRPCNGY